MPPCCIVPLFVSVSSFVYPFDDMWPVDCSLRLSLILSENTECFVVAVIVEVRNPLVIFTIIGRENRVESPGKGVI